MYRLRNTITNKKMFNNFDDDFLAVVLFLKYSILFLTRSGNRCGDLPGGETAAGIHTKDQGPGGVTGSLPRQVEHGPGGVTVSLARQIENGPGGVTGSLPRQVEHMFL